MELLQQPQTLWISLTLILIATGVVFSASRGGLLAFLAAGVVTLTLLFRRSARFVHWEAGLIIGCGCLALLTWFGLERVQARLGTLLDGAALQDSRISLLARMPPLVRDFPIWGTGYGSLDYVEPIYRTDASDSGWSYQHAHNEYLEAMIEGGLVRLALSLLGIGLVFRAAYSALCRYRDHWAGGLVLGGLFGFTTLVLHSIVDFGIHLPAIALFAAVLCGHLVALGEPERISEPGAAGKDLWVKTRVLFVPLAAAVLVCLGLILVAEGWREAEVRRLSVAAWALRESTDPEDQLRRLALLEEAVSWDPANARVQFEVGERHAALYEALKQKHFDEEGTQDGVQSVLLLNLGCAPAAGSNIIPSLLLTTRQLQECRRQAITELERQHGVPALRHFLQARNLNPTRAKVHLEIAPRAELLDKVNVRRTYADRALALDPMNPEFWYRAGVLEVFHGKPDQACKDWRRSLELSDVCLKKIVERGLNNVGPRHLLNRVLPDQPRLLVTVANMIYPKPQTRERRAFFEKARILYERLPGPWDTEDIRQKAMVLAELGKPREAIEAYRAALLQKPQQLDWRFELAQLLVAHEKFQEARQELSSVLALQPQHDPARELLRKVEREIAKGRI